MKHAMININTVQVVIYGLTYTSYAVWFQKITNLELTTAYLIPTRIV